MRQAWDCFPHLRDEDAPGVEVLLQHGVELRRVELVAGATLERVIQVHDNDVERAFLLQNSLKEKRQGGW